MTAAVAFRFKVCGCGISLQLCGSGISFQLCGSGASHSGYSSSCALYQGNRGKVTSHSGVATLKFLVIEYLLIYTYIGFTLPVSWENPVVMARTGDCPEPISDNRLNL